MRKENYLFSEGFLGEKKEDGSVVLLRAYGSVPVLAVPQFLEGMPVTEIGDYCFSRKGNQRLLQAGNEPGKEAGFLQEICGDRLEALELPDSVRKIGNYAFYNCKKLTKLCMGRFVEELGSDVFMNCVGLKQITVRGSIHKASGLKQTLSRISTTIEVVFQEEGRIEAALLYPEYSETYDEIAPAHLFGRNITGEGFRARQCFRDGVVELSAYDSIFPKACVEESGEVLERLALNRLRYPVGLTEECRTLYADYVRAHGRELAARLVKKHLAEELHFLCREGYFDGNLMAEAVSLAAEADWTEGAASLMAWKQAYGSETKKDRYSFDEW